MDKNYSVALKSIVRSDYTFFKYWYDFHFNIEKYVGEEKYQNLIDKYSKKIFDIMLACPASRGEIKRLILHECGFCEEVDYDVTSKVLPFAMLSQETIKKLVIIVGALICFKDITKIISKKQLDEIFKLIDRDVFTFIVKRSLLFWKKIPNLHEDYSKIKLTERMELCGKLVFEYAIASMPKSVIDRLKLRSNVEFKCANCSNENDMSKAADLLKYALNNFFSDREDVKLCLK